MSNIGFDLSMYPTLNAMAQSDAIFRTCRGPAGSAKTSWSFVELLRRACEQEPAEDGVRYTRWLIGRLTYQVLASATLETARTSIGEVVQFRESTPPTGKAVFKLPDGTWVNTEFEFISLEGLDAEQKLLGYEPTGALLDEISEMPESIVHAVIRRCGRFPAGRFGSPTWTGVIGVTNGPLEGHWLQEWEMGKRARLFRDLEEEIAKTGKRRPYFHAFAQPPALIRPTVKGEPWKPNPLAENVHNLKAGYGYYFTMLAEPDDAKIRAFVEGDFAPLKTGKVVFPQFNRKLHVIKEADVTLPFDVPLGLSFDFGRTPVCLVYANTSGGRLLQIEEIMAEDTAVDLLVQDYVRPLLREKYPHSRVIWATGDPAGEVKGQQVDTSPYEVLWNLGIPIENPGGSNLMDPRIEAVVKYLTKLDRTGTPMLQIRDNCRFTIEALGRNYIYEQVSKHNSEAVRDKPTKSHVNWVSDLADAVQYACLYNQVDLRPVQVTPKLPKLNHRWA